MSRLLASIAFACVAMLGAARLVRAQHRSSIGRAPKALVAQVLHDAEASGNDFLRYTLDRGGWLSVERVDLDGDGKPELFVNGSGSSCGANNCPTWVYRVTPHGYELLLDAGGAATIEARKMVSHGYRDVLTYAGGDAYSFAMKLYRFDGQRYHLLRCFRSYDGYEDAQGHWSQFKRPRLKRVSCELG